jgi:hypothetical protein
MGNDPPRRLSVQISALTFEREFEHWIRTHGAVYRLDLTDDQIARLVERAASIARRHGMT